MGNAVELTQRSNLKVPSVAAELVELGRALRGLLDPYRPERHYMRGPGPKWHAKHNMVPAVADTHAADFALQLRLTTIKGVAGTAANYSA